MVPTAHRTPPPVALRAAPARSRAVVPLAGVALALSAGAALAAAGALSARLVAVVTSHGPGIAAGIAGVDAVVELAVLAAGVLVAWWLSAGLIAAALSAAARAFGHRWSAGERFVARHAPALVRRALALAVGAGVGLASVAAAAAAQPSEPPADLNWAVTQTAGAAAELPAAAAPTGAEAAQAAQSAQSSAVGAPLAPQAPGTPRAPAPPPGTPAPPAQGTVTVAAGDSLWRIAADHLPEGAGAGEIAAAWPRLYEANRDIVGADPALIIPGQVLTIPATSPSAEDKS